MMMRIIMKKQNAKRAKKYVKNIRKRSAKNKIMTKRRKSSLLSSLTWILADYGGLKNKSLKLLTVSNGSIWFHSLQKHHTKSCMRKY